jgi:hypothetical protein
MKVSYCITVCNEFEEIQRLIPRLLEYKREEDEIIVLLDISNQTYQLTEYLQKLRYDGAIQLQGAYFDGHFADWKNKFKELSTGDYIFQIDADELPTRELLADLPYILGENNIDLFLVPRDNKVKGITQEHIQKWGWNVDSLGRVNFPDYQTRIYKNSPDIKWINKVHERIDGYKTYAALPHNYFLHHIKTIERQEKQNSYYETL